MQDVSRTVMAAQTNRSPNAVPAEPVIEARELIRRFPGGIVAVDRVSLAVARGEVLGLLGPNGAGKTTTIRMCAGYLAPTAGSARLAGVDVHREPVRAQRALGYLPEGSPLYAEMSPRAMLRFIAEVRGLRGRARTAAVDRAIARARIEHVAHQPIDTLSKGYRRRVGLAQAILHEPPALILDEPTDGLDPNQKRAVRELVAELRQTSAVIVSTHLLEEVDALCTRTAVIARGRTVFDGTPAELRALDPARGTVTLRVRTVDNTADVRAAFGAIRDVELVERAEGDGVRTVVIRPKAGVSASARAGLGAEAAACARAASLHVERLDVEPGRLDEVFRQLTEPDRKPDPNTDAEAERVA